MNFRLAISIKLLSVLLFAVMSVLVRYVGETVPLGQVVFFRSAFAIIPVMVIYAWRGELGAEPVGATEGAVGGHIEIGGLNFVVGERAGKRIEIFAVVGIGESFVGDERADDGAGNDGRMPFRVVEARERDGLGLGGEFAGRFEAPVAVEKNLGVGRIVAIHICRESRTEGERNRKHERGVKPGHKQAS